MDARKITKVLLVLNVLFSACAGFPEAQTLSAKGDSYEYPQFNANSNISQNYGNTAETNKEQLIDNKDVQHESANNKEWMLTTPEKAPALADRAVVGGHEGHDQRPLSAIRAMHESDRKLGKLAVKRPAAHEHAVEQEPVFANRDSRIKRHVESHQNNDNSTVTNTYIGDAKGAIKDYQNITRSEVVNHNGQAATLPVPPSPTHVVTRLGWIPTTPEKALALTDCSVVVGHTENLGPLWVIRAMYESNLLPGQLDVNNRTAYVTWLGLEHKVEQIEVLCAPPSSVDWVKSSNGHVPPNAILGCHNSIRIPMYIARATEQGSLILGKLYPYYSCLYVTYNGVELCKKDYEVLCKT